MIMQIILLIDKVINEYYVLTKSFNQKIFLHF